MGDKRLNNLAALTYNVKSCSTIFAMIEKALSASENSWKTILKALLLLHTIVLYGPEVAIDRAVSICRLGDTAIYDSIGYTISHLTKGTCFF